MSDTPRIDALCKTRNCGYWGIPYEFACELERELGQVRLLMSKAHEVSVTIDQRYNARVRELEVRNADLVNLISQFDAAIRRIAAELTGKACGGVDTGDNINPETGEPYGHGGHTGWLLAEEAKKLKTELTSSREECTELSHNKKILAAVAETQRALLDTTNEAADSEHQRAESAEAKITELENNERMK